MATLSPPVLAGPSPYPVHVDADPSPGLSRWLWLVKWVLVIPHAIVLAFLWTAFAVLTLVAFVAILATGRYPRRIFEFNVGVLRWSWRVAYYSYGALATDRYPPFTLDDVADYPAHLDVDHPGHLSRGLVLVKWWLLALPHYVVVAVFLGTGAQTVRVVSDGVVTEGWEWRGGLIGLIGLLALIAAVTLAVRGAYPQGLYDLILGLHRWVLRVAAYAGLMTDVYPPFRLDTGGHDPGHAFASTRVPSGPPPVVPTVPVGPAGTPAPGAAGPLPAPAGRGSRGGRPPGGSAAVGGVVLLVLGAGALASGATVGIAQLTMRDGAYVTGTARDVSTPGYAVQVGEVSLHAPDVTVSWIQDLVGDVRVRVVPEDGAAVFVGVAREQDAARYLDGVEHTTVEGPADVAREWSGGAPGTAPTATDIWVAQSVGAGPQEVRGALEAGDWVAVVMPADGTRGVQARIDVGATVPWLGTAATVAVLLGLVLVVGGAVLVGRGAPSRPPSGPAAGRTTGPTAPAATRTT